MYGHVHPRHETMFLLRYQLTGSMSNHLDVISGHRPHGFPTRPLTRPPHSASYQCLESVRAAEDRRIRHVICPVRPVRDKYASVIGKSLVCGVTIFLVFRCTR